jgi:hypothetical protein
MAHRDSLEDEPVSGEDDLTSLALVQVERDAGKGNPKPTRRALDLIQIFPFVLRLRIPSQRLACRISLFLGFSTGQPGPRFAVHEMNLRCLEGHH